MRPSLAAESEKRSAASFIYYAKNIMDDFCSYETLITAAGKECVPVGALFELTHRCNLRCSHCYLHDYSGYGELTREEWLRVISEFADLGGMWLSFTGGEIFLREDIFELMSHAKKLGFALKLLTNAQLLDEAKIVRVSEIWPAEIDISFYAATPAIHDAITLREGSWERTLAAASRLCELGLRVVLKTPIMSCNLHEIPALQELADNIGAKLRLDTDIMPKNDSSTGPLSKRLNSAELEELFQLPQMQFRIPPSGVEPTASDCDLCGAARRTFAISPIGDVQPCLSNPVSMGNVHDQSLADIWYRSPAMLSYRGLTVADLHEECLTCDQRAYCGRCGALAALEDGDYLGKSQWACQMAAARKNAASSSDI